MSDGECFDESLLHGFANMSGISRPSLAALDWMAHDTGALLHA